MPKRIQLSRARGWRMPAGARKVDRSTPWGNPFKILEPERGAYGRSWRVVFVPRVGQARPDWAPEVEQARHPTREGAELAMIAAFRRWMGEPGRAELLERGCRELRGHDLACWCKPGHPCHSEVWIELVNGERAGG